jgi:hypothetical protein
VIQQYLGSHARLFSSRGLNLISGTYSLSLGPRDPDKAEFLEWLNSVRLSRVFTVRSWCVRLFRCLGILVDAEASAPVCGW